jgi:hypothetical protein
MEKEKLKLSEVKVESFVAQLIKYDAKTIQGQQNQLASARSDCPLECYTVLPIVLSHAIRIN